MFPKFQNFGKTTGFLLRENGWFSFLNPDLSESERTETLSGLLSDSENTRSLAQKHVEDSEDAEAFQEAYAGWHDTLQKVRAHTARTTQENLKEYIQIISLIEARYTASPNYLGCQLLREHCRNLSELYGDLQAGTHDDNFTRGLLEGLRRQLSEHMLLESYCQPEECEKAHSKFVSAFQKQFKITVSRFEGLGVGVALYLDQCAHNALQDEIRSVYRSLEDFLAEHDYILLRSGKQTDIEYGEYPNPTSRWLFVYTPKPVDQDLGSLETISAKEYKPISLK